MIYKAKINKKYPFKQMKPGETFKLDDEDVRNAQKMAWYYRVRCKRPITKRAMMVTNAAGSREGALQVLIAALGPAALILACAVAVLGAGWMLAPLLAG